MDILSDDCQHTFQAFAEITNGTKQEYKIDRTELFGGDVLLQRDVGARRRRERSRSRSRSRSLSNTDEEDDEEVALCDTMPTIDAQGELAGKSYFY